MRRTLPAPAFVLSLALALDGVPTPVAAQTPVARQSARLAAEAPPPTLVILITVDQLRTDYFDRFASQLTGGLARLSRGGAFFVNAYQDHAITETAPGHAVTLSGRFPRSTGVVQNVAGVQDPQAPLIDKAEPSSSFPFRYRTVPGQGASPFRFRGTALIDWLRIADPRSRALSVSRKDRGAILPLGRAKQDVYWYAESGIFTTSTYYRDTLPDWVERFNARAVPAAIAEREWRLLLPESAYAEPDSVPVENRGQNFVFPHRLPADPVQAARLLPTMPWMDRLTLDLALEGIDRLGLGRGPHPDLLAVSLSTTDAVGHTYGPDSRELHDQVLRLDRYLGAFLDSLYKVRDSSTIAIALTADHGVQPYPQLRARRVPNARAQFVNVAQVVQQVADSLARSGLPRGALRFDDGLFFLDRAAVTRAGIDTDRLQRQLRQRLLRMPGVMRIDFLRDFARVDTTKDAIARRWLHMVPADFPVEMVLTLEPGAYWSGVTYATHGTPHDEDAQVPVIFYGPWFRSTRLREFATVADIAPTLAHVLRVSPLERLDGRVLRAALLAPPSGTSGR